MDRRTVAHGEEDVIVFTQIGCVDDANAREHGKCTTDVGKNCAGLGVGCGEESVQRAGA